MSSKTTIKFLDLELSEGEATLTDTKGSRLALAIERQPKPPCVDRGDGKPCEYFRRCASEELACSAFFAYTREPMARKEYAEWRTMERLPTRRLYLKVYKAMKADELPKETREMKD